MNNPVHYGISLCSASQPVMPFCHRKLSDKDGRIVSASLLKQFIEHLCIPLVKLVVQPLVDYEDVVVTQSLPVPGQLFKVIPPVLKNNFPESSALISWGFQNLFFKNHPLFSQKHLTNQSKNAALRALDQKVHFLIGGDF